MSVASRVTFAVLPGHRRGGVEKVNGEVFPMKIIGSGNTTGTSALHEADRKANESLLQVYQSIERSGQVIDESKINAALVLGACTLVIVAEALLPPIMLDLSRLGPLLPYVGLPIALIGFATVVVLSFRGHSMIDLWVLVVMSASILIPLSYVFYLIRFEVGWDAVRYFAAVSSCLILIFLLYEVTMLYCRRLGAILEQRRERDARLTMEDAVAATIAHEFRQPLAAMMTLADTGFRWLDRPDPDLEKAKVAFRRIAADGLRAEAVIESIRASVKQQNQVSALLDVNDLIGKSVALMREDLRSHRVLVKAEPNLALPPVMGDRTQLQQVLVNLIANAIDAMAVEDGPRVLSVSSEVRDGEQVVISVADTGPGIASQDIQRVFKPLFTTKAGGMGLGLSICRSIIERHRGRLAVVPNSPKGAIFQIGLLGHTDSGDQVDRQISTPRLRRGTEMSASR
jgi:signal transduction histidine kinase